MLNKKLKYKETISALKVKPKQIWSDSKNLEAERTSFFQVQYVERGIIFCTLYKGKAAGYVMNTNGLYGFGTDTIITLNIVEPCE